MFPKLEEVPISTYLIVLAKMRLPSTMPLARISRSLSSRTMSAASLATSVAVSTEMPTSASWSATASLTPSPRKPTVVPSCRCALITRDFCSGVTRAKIVVSGSAAASLPSSSWSSCVPVRVPRTLRPRSPQTLWATRSFAGDHLDLDAELVKARERVGSICLRPVEEGEKAGQLELGFVFGSERLLPVRGACCDRDHAAAGGELRLEHALRLRPDSSATGEHRFGRAFDDHLAGAVGRFDEDGHALALIVEGSCSETTICRRLPHSHSPRLPELPWAL